jgi:tRNA(fMet)-specific endonuclease VapC
VFLLDTNTVIFFFKGRQAVVDRWLATPPEQVRISSVTLYELLVGAAASSQPEPRRRHVESLLTHLAVLPFTAREAEAAATLQGALLKQGRGIGGLDAQIAGTALAHGLSLVSNHIGEFSRVAGLSVVDWTRPA